MTFSVGMRAPSRAELLLDFVEHVAERLPEQARYGDPDLAPARHAGEIDTAALARVADTLGPAAGLAGPAGLADWFGRFITRYRSAQFAAPPPHGTPRPALDHALRHGAVLLRHPWTRLAWLSGETGDAAATLFVAGEALPCPRPLAERLCTRSRLVFDTAPGEAELDVLLLLLNQGHLIIGDDA